MEADPCIDIREDNYFYNYQEILNEKTSKVNIHFFNSHIACFVSKIAFYAGAGAAAVAYAPSVIIIPTLFAAKFLAVAFFPIPVVAIVTSVVAALFIGEILRKRKELLYEISLLYTLFGNKEWWNTITPQIVLGAIPLGPHHAQRLKKEGVNAVLTMLEDFELEQGIVQPISSDEWAQQGIEHHHIKAVDFTGVPVDQIQQGVAFLENQIRDGKKVYVHCKAGRGRSATIVVAYLLKQSYAQTNTTFSDAYAAIHQQVKAARPQINLNANQQQTIRDYYQRYCA
jgi:atypical dual specificity phosphatase